MDFFLILVVVNIILIIKSISNMSRVEEILGKLNTLHELVLNDEVAEKELIDSKNAEIEALKAELEETKANGGLTAEEEEVAFALIEEKIIAIEAGIGLSETAPVEETETPTVEPEVTEPVEETPVVEEGTTPEEGEVDDEVAEGSNN